MSTQTTSIHLQQPAVLTRPRQWSWSSRILAITALIVAALLVWRLSGVLLVLFFGALNATLLRGCANVLANRLRAPLRLMLVVIAGFILVALCAVAWWILPLLAGQASDLIHRLGSQLQALQNQYGDTSIGRAVTQHLSNAAGLEQRVGADALSIAHLTLSTIADFFVIIVLSLYLAEASEFYLNGTVRLFPPAHRVLARSVLLDIGHDLRRWLLGQSVDMLAVGGLSAIGLYFLGVPAPFALAILAGLLTIVPYFGALVAAVPGVLVALTQSWVTALWVVLIFTCCHIVEGYVIAPLVQRRMVHMPPAVIIGALAVSGALFGPVGIILGTPLAVVALVLVRRVYLERILGDPITP